MLGYTSYTVMVKIMLSVAKKKKKKAVTHVPYLCTNYTARSSDTGDI